MIKQYIEDTGSRYPIYADPSQAVYKTLGLRRSLALGEKKPDYITFGLREGIVKGFWKVLKAGTNAFKAGDFKQNGGEYVWLTMKANIGFCLAPEKTVPGDIR